MYGLSIFDELKLQGLDIPVGLLSLRTFEPCFDSNSAQFGLVEVQVQLVELNGILFLGELKGTKLIFIHI